MSEAFLHYIWQHQYFDKTDLATATDQRVNIIQPGHYNTDAGPDFKEAALFIDDIEWRGQVEIHLKSSDWDAHQHQTDKAYNNTILHVVWLNDKEIKRQDGTTIPTVEIAYRVNKHLLERYNLLLKKPSQHIPCENQLVSVKLLTKIEMMDKALMSRLERKSLSVRGIHEQNKQDWEETAYQLLASNFGFKINSEPFFTLARSLPFKILKKHGDNPFQVEALLFGQAGFLEVDEKDEYYEKLKKEYEFLRQKYRLEQVLSEHQWKLLRLRPANFPTVRIAQLATFIASANGVFSLFLEAGVKDIVKKLSPPVSDYWHRHYQFGKETSKRSKRLGQNSAENICINTVSPLLVAYGKAIDEHKFIEKAEELLQELKAEKNRIVDKMKEVGFEVRSAFDSQAVLELHNNYCIKSRCLQCSIGAKLVRP